MGFWRDAGIFTNGVVGGITSSVAGIAGGAVDLAAKGANLVPGVDVGKTNFSENWNEAGHKAVGTWIEPQNEHEQNVMHAGEVTGKGVTIAAAAVGAAVTLPVSGTLALATAGVAGGAAYLGSDPDAAESFGKGLTGAAKLAVDDPARFATVAVDGLENGVSSGLGFVGGAVAGIAGGTVGLVADVGNLGLRGISGGRWGRDSGSFTWDFAKGGFTNVNDGLHWTAKRVVFDNVIDRGINLVGEVTHLGTMDRAPELTTDGERFTFGTGTFAGSFVGVGLGAKALKLGGSALMAAFNSSARAETVSAAMLSPAESAALRTATPATGADAAAIAASTVDAAAATAKTSKTLGFLQSRAIFSNAKIPLADKVAKLVEGGRVDLAERAVRLARVENGAAALPIEQLRAGGRLSEAFLNEMAGAQSSATGLGLTRLTEPLSARWSYYASNPAQGALRASWDAAKLGVRGLTSPLRVLKAGGQMVTGSPVAGVKTLASSPASLVTGGVLYSIPGVRNGVRDGVGKTFAAAGNVIDDHVDGPVGDVAGATLRGAGSMIATSDGAKDIEHDSKDQNRSNNPFDSLGLNGIFGNVADQMHENPLLWGSLIGLGTFLATDVGASFVPGLKHFSGLIALATAAVAVYALYEQGNKRAAGPDQNTRQPTDKTVPGLDTAAPA